MNENKKGEKIESKRNVLVKEIIKLYKHMLYLFTVIQENKKQINEHKRVRESSVGYLSVVHEIFSGNGINDRKRNYGLEVLNKVIRELSNGDQK